MNGKKKGVLSPAVPVPVTDLPPPPPTPTVTVAEGKINVQIVAPEGLRKPVLPFFPSSIGENAAASAPTAAVVAAGVASQTVPTEAPQASPETPPEEATEPNDETPVPAPAPTAPPSADAPAVQPQAPPVPCPAVPDAGATASETGAAGADKPVVPCVPPGSTLLPARALSPLPTPIYGYMVYEMAPPEFKPPVLQPGAAPPYPVLLTQQAVTDGTWSDTRFDVGVERCYSVTTVETLGQIVSESAPTPTVCVKTVDVFPPAAPKNLQAVASEGTISLIWDSNTEPDLAGYIVLRGPAGADKLTAITPTPIKESTFRDTAVKAGVRYAYVIVAVDSATPQNVSAQSNRVEETAR
jgi:hypothetical protein